MIRRTLIVRSIEEETSEEALSPHAIPVTAFSCGANC
jgi:hypothetical protein